MAISQPLVHPPLSEVAFEINFPRQFLVENRIAEFQQAISDSYPSSGDEFVVRFPPSVGFGKPTRPGGSGVTPVRSFVFQNQEGTRSVKTSLVNINFVVTDYKDFGEYKSALLAVITPALRIFELRRVERFGLRYINKINVPREKGALAFRDYVRCPLDLSIIGSHELTNFLVEVNLSLDSNKKLTIREGLLPTAPQETSYSYLLDLDSYSEDMPSISVENLPTILDDYHDAIEMEFRRSITERHWRYLSEGR